MQLSSKIKQNFALKWKKSLYLSTVQNRTTWPCLTIKMTIFSLRCFTNLTLFPTNLIIIHKSKILPILGNILGLNIHLSHLLGYPFSVSTQQRPKPSIFFHPSPRVYRTYLSIAPSSNEGPQNEPSPIEAFYKTSNKPK